MKLLAFLDGCGVSGDFKDTAHPFRRLSPIYNSRSGLVLKDKEGFRCSLGEVDVIKYFRWEGSVVDLLGEGSLAYPDQFTRQPLIDVPIIGAGAYNLISCKLTIM